MPPWALIWRSYTSDEANEADFDGITPIFCGISNKYLALLACVLLAAMFSLVFVSTSLVVCKMELRQFFCCDREREVWREHFQERRRRTNWVLSLPELNVLAPAKPYSVFVEQMKAQPEMEAETNEAMSMAASRVSNEEQENKGEDEADAGETQDQMRKWLWRRWIRRRRVVCAEMQMPVEVQKDTFTPDYTTDYLCSICQESISEWPDCSNSITKEDEPELLPADEEVAHTAAPPVEAPEPTEELDISDARPGAGFPEDGSPLIRQLPCKHVFHDMCIVPWVTGCVPTCPLCKSILKD